MKQKQDDRKEQLKELYGQLRTDQQRAFIFAYFGLSVDGDGNERQTAMLNPTQAAKAAGYPHPRRQGYRLKNHPVISQIISIYLDELAMSKSEVLARLASHARANMADFVNDDGSFNASAVKTHGHLIKKMTFRKRTTRHETVEEHEIELYDAQRAIIQIGKHHGLWKPAKDQSTSIDIEVIANSFDVLVGLLPDESEQEDVFLPMPDVDIIDV